MYNFFFISKNKFFIKPLNKTVFINNNNFKKKKICFFLGKNFFNFSKFYFFKKNEKLIFNENFFNFFNLTNLIESIFYNNKKLLLIDDNLISFLPLYKLIFNKNQMSELINFLLNFSKNKIIYKNYLYFYKNFIETNNIIFVFFFNYTTYINYFNYFLKFNVSLGSLIFNKMQSIYLDYYIIIDSINMHFVKFFLYNNILLNFFNINNFFKINNKNYFYKNFIKLL